MTKALALTAVLAMVACSSAAQQNAGESSAAGQVGDRVITVAEVEQRWREKDPGEHAQAIQAIYDGRRAAFDALVSEMLVAEAAKEAGLSPAAYEEAEISKRVKQVTDAEVRSFYSANISQMQGQPFEDMAPLINRFLQEQNQNTARGEVIAELRSKAPAIRVMLDAPRHPVTVQASDPIRGDASAPVTIVEFSDFQCPFCRQASPTLKKVQDTYGEKVRIVWKDFPLTDIHPQAFKAAEAAHCAGEQGKYWEFHDRLFSSQDALQPPALKGHAVDMKLDATAFATCLDSSKYAERVRDGVAAGTLLGVDSTPTMYINGRRVAGAYPYETIAAIVDEELQRAGQ